jgi:hypothetical protein
VLADIGTSNSIILALYISAPFINTNDSKTGLWRRVAKKPLKLGYACDFFTPRIKSQETNLFSLIISFE